MSKPESETDQWKAIQRYELVQTNFAYTTDHEMERDAEGEWARWEAVESVRAAEAAQHQQALIDARRAEHTVWKGRAEAAEASLAAVEAERDQKTAEVETLRGVGCNEDGNGPCGACLKCARAERDRLKAALQDVTIGMDRAGGDRDGMPECPWCQSQGRPEDAEEGYAHDVDCSLMMARAALPTQGQSTDGETR